jgi:hypothetical protein
VRVCVGAACTGERRQSGSGGRNRHAREWNRAPAAPGDTREWASTGLERFAGGARAERGRRRAGGVSVRAVMRGNWWCVQVLGGRNGAGPWARAGDAGVRRAEQRHAQEELWWRAIARDAGTRWPYRGRSSGVRRNADTRGDGEREGEGPAVGRGVKSAGRRRADVATACREVARSAGGAAAR